MEILPPTTLAFMRLMSDLVVMPFIPYHKRQLEPFKYSDSPDGSPLATDIFPAFQYSEGLHFKTHRIDGTGPLKYIKYKNKR